MASKSEYKESDEFVVSRSSSLASEVPESTETHDVFPPPCECAGCKSQFRSVNDQQNEIQRYGNSISDNEARKLLERHISFVQPNFQYITDECHLHGKAIIKRWMKKSKAERIKFLLEIDPDIFLCQWCEPPINQSTICKHDKKRVEKYKSVGPEHIRSASRFYTLMPCINLESLSNSPNQLLRILWSRVKYSPEQWAPYDDFSRNKKWKSGALELTFNANCIILHGHDFGKLTKWEKDLAHSSETGILGYPRGILVLEAQSGLFAFLRCAVDRLLEGLDSIPAQVPEYIPAIPAQTTDLDTTWSRIDIQSSPWTYPALVPQPFDIQHLLEITNTQINTQSDHVWLLQTDTRYLRKHVTTIIAGHLQEKTKGAVRQVATTTKISHEVSMYLSWQWILEEVEKVSKVHDNYKDEILPGHKFPEEYVKALVSLEALLSDLVRRRTYFLGLLLPERPGFSRGWTTTPISSNISGYIRVRKEGHKDLAKIYDTDRLEYCLLKITVNPHAIPGQVECQHYWELFGLLEDHMSSCAKEVQKEDALRLDDEVTTLIADLSAILRLLTMVQLHIPHAPRSNLKEVRDAGQGKTWRYMRATFLNHTPSRRQPNDREYWPTSDEILHEEDHKIRWESQKYLGGMLDKFLKCPQPSGPRASQARLDAELKERDSMREFWDAMRDCHVKLCRHIGIENADIDGDIRLLSADKNPQYLEEIQTNVNEALARIFASEAGKVKSSDAAAKSLLEDWAGEKSNETKGNQKKLEKKKTRGATPKVLKEPDPVPEAEPEPVAPRIQVAVNKRAHAVFKGMYPGDDLEARSQSVQWNAFVTALAAPGVDFVTSGGGGSEYSFAPTETSRWAGMGSIVFHRPHPDGEIDPIKLTGWGKRMEKWFGWSGDNFLLRK